MCQMPGTHVSGYEMCFRTSVREHIAREAERNVNNSPFLLPSMKVIFPLASGAVTTIQKRGEEKKKQLGEQRQ